MKIRLIGSSDIVRAWGRELERAYGIKGKEYPSRYSTTEVRLYVDLDDRQAAMIVGLQDGDAQHARGPVEGTAGTALPGRSRTVRR